MKPPYIVPLFLLYSQGHFLYTSPLKSKVLSHKEDLESLSGRELGVSVAKGMVNFSNFLDFPTCLRDVSGISEELIERCLTAAKNPQVE